MSEIIEDTIQDATQEAKQKASTKAVNKLTSKFSHNSANYVPKPKDHLQDPLEISSITEEEIAELESVNHTINAMSLGPGNLLKVTREEAKLSKEDVAQELRLTVRHIDYLEQDAYHKFPAVAFYIGYLRNYSKFLGLDPNKLIAKFHAVYKAAPESPVYKKTLAVSSSTILKNLSEHWPFNFFTKERTRTPALSTNGIKYLLLVVSVLTIVSVLWWLVATVNVQNDKIVTENVMQLAPEVVDELLPTSPVIVKNTLENIDNPENSDNTRMLSQNTFDKQDELQDIS